MENKIYKQVVVTERKVRCYMERKRKSLKLLKISKIKDMKEKCKTAVRKRDDHYDTSLIIRNQ